MKRSLVLLVAVFWLVEGLTPFIQNTQYGRVRGKWLRTARNRLVAAFLGIPYAEPPVGPLRFKSPRPWTKPWYNVRDATKDGSMCPQLRYFGHFEGDEDCLYLNVFVPFNDSANSASKLNKKLPVLVYLHGGSFIMGSNNSTRISPDYILDNDVILVSVNYRLDFLGFFSTGNNVSPGNFALKDVITALKWVRDNIRLFGGDPESVTLQGHSAGSVITQMLSLTKKTEGLFHRMIVQSGSALGTWAFHTRSNIRRTSLEMARLAGCKVPDDDYSLDLYINDDTLQMYHDTRRRIQRDHHVVECMRKKDLQTLFNVSRYYRIWKTSPSMVFGPTLEFDTEDAVLTMHPRKVFAEGLFRDVPWIMGVVSDEGVFVTMDVYGDNNATHELITDFNWILPHMMESHEIIQDKEVFGNAIKDRYFSNDIGRHLIHNLTQLISEFIFYWPDYQALQYYNKFSNVDGYYYYFSYEGTLSQKMQQTVPFHYGVCHGDDMTYQFPYYMYQSSVENSANDRSMIDLITRMWANFIKTGSPNGKNMPYWEPYKMNNEFMHFGSGRLPRGSMEENFLADNMVFWHRLMNNVSSPLTELVVTDELVLPHIDHRSRGICITHEYYVIIGALFLAMYWLHLSIATRTLFLP